MAPPRLVTSGELANALGLHMRTIQRYRAEGLIQPEVITKGKHARWDVEKVRQQLLDRARNDEKPPAREAGD